MKFGDVLRWVRGTDGLYLFLAHIPTAHGWGFLLAIDDDGYGMAPESLWLANFEVDA